jgi:hypothetical protein
MPLSEWDCRQIDLQIDIVALLCVCGWNRRSLVSVSLTNIGQEIALYCLLTSLYVQWNCLQMQSADRKQSFVLKQVDFKGLNSLSHAS